MLKKYLLEEIECLTLCKNENTNINNQFVSRRDYRIARTPVW